MVTLHSFAFAGQTSTPYQHQGRLFPPVYFQTNITTYPLKKRLRYHQAFKAFTEQENASPIAIVAIEGTRVKSDLTLLSSLTLSAATLGIFPLASNDIHQVTYLIFVNGELFTRYEYQMTSLEIKNIWATKADQIQKPEKSLFLEQSVNSLLHEIAANEELAELFEEYYLYAPSDTQ
ncbi:hypothetical protein [Aliamphritea spongicola]|uniref:hypothetical protein n=1 Tax=Aliamphritea spongicola TaxID=707589 RepID=UPI00196A9E20|nr:hypothetical protein [Aliamphritea spongicola]MBN3563664.1 hypothetical protein [Aliamphritea spongicola]